MINEGGPGSGPQGGSSSSDETPKPKVLAHYDYQGPRYTAGVKVPKPSSPTYRQVWKGESKEHSMPAATGPIHMSTYPLAKGGALLTYPPQKTSESGSPITLGGKLSQSYPHSPTEADSGSAFAGLLRGKTNEKNF